MTAFRFQRAAEEADDAPWRPLDRAVLRWTLAHGGSPLLARIAAWASLADGEGDTALTLADEGNAQRGMAPLSDAHVQALRSEPLVSAGECAAPFVIDAAGRFYLWRNYAHEVAVARLFHQRRAGATSPVTDAALLDELFLHDTSPAVQRQRDAVAAVAGCKLFVLTGGPGTGKTTTVLRMLLMLQRLGPDSVAPRLQVSAPTGKAAQRLLQSLRRGKQQLRDALPAAWQPALAGIPDGDALTLHRLLGYDPRRNRFTRDASHPIAADIVVVDEASMIDLAMLHALLRALQPEATLILVGDADQLTSVAAGSALMDLVTVMERERASDLVRLEHSFRAGQPLVPINQAVRAGDAGALREAFAAADSHAHWVAVDSIERLRSALAQWSVHLAALPIRPTLPASVRSRSADAAAEWRDGAEKTIKVNALVEVDLADADVEDVRAAMALQALRALAQRQLLCALREDAFGALAANAWIEQRLKRLWELPEDGVWYPGRAVLITRNDYAARLYNGDVGLCLADADGRLRVWFENTGADGQPTARSFSPGTLPAHHGAFAITIHKSQGSEYDFAAVLLPPDPAHRILSRQLLYTGLSRARATVQLWASDGAVLAALAQPVQRAGGLAERLAMVDAARTA